MLGSRHHLVSKEVKEQYRDFESRPYVRVYEPNIFFHYSQLLTALVHAQAVFTPSSLPSRCKTLSDDQAATSQFKTNLNFTMLQ